MKEFRGSIEVFPPWSAQITESGIEAKVVPRSQRNNVTVRGIGMGRELQASRRYGENEAGKGGEERNRW